MRFIDYPTVFFSHLRSDDARRAFAEAALEEIKALVRGAAANAALKDTPIVLYTHDSVEVECGAATLDRAQQLVLTIAKNRVPASPIDFTLKLDETKLRGWREESGTGSSGGTTPTR